MPSSPPNPISALRQARERRHAPLVLELDLTEELIEEGPHDPLGAALTYRKPKLHYVVDGLRRAEGDPRVGVLVAKIGATSTGLARMQDIRAAVLSFRAAGKRAIAWAETFGEFGPGTVPYYLATAFDEIWLQPSGDVGLTGVAVEAVFLREALDKAGIEPQLGQRYEYKNAADTFLRRGFTDAYRDASAGLAASVAEQLADGIAGGRGLDPNTVRDLLGRGPYGAQQALEAGLVDQLGYRDEVYAAARSSGGDSARLQFLGRYRKEAMRSGFGRLAPTRLARHRSRKVVAVVQASGAVRLGRSSRRPLTGASMGSDTVTAALRSAARDDAVGAVVLRVDSPGGSYVASDAIWREVGRTREAGKPVVVSMGDVAASGGYFVAMSADAIVAQPGTLTGSIGVLGGKAVTRDLWARIGVGRDAVTEGEHALMFSAQRPFDEAEWAQLERWLDHVYHDFTAKVAQGRGLSREHVHEVARGRVWTGRDARERGLVDELGGLRHAVEIARQRGGLPADAEARSWPRVSPLDRARPARSSEDPAAAAAAHLTAGWGPWAAIAAAAGLPAAGPLTLPGGWRVR